MPSGLSHCHARKQAGGEQAARRDMAGPADQRDITTPWLSNQSWQRGLNFVSTAIAQELLGIGQLAVSKFSFNNFSLVCFPF